MILIACRGALFGSAYSYVGAEKQIRRQPRKSNWAGAIGKGKRGWRAEELAESRYQAAANRGNQMQRRRHAAPSPSIGANKALQPTAYRAASFGGWFRVRCARRGGRRLSTTLAQKSKFVASLANLIGPVQLAKANGDGKLRSSPKADAKPSPTAPITCKGVAMLRPRQHWRQQGTAADRLPRR